MAMPAQALPTNVANLAVIPANPQLTRPGRGANILRVAAYCRVSTEQEEQQSSYEAQIEYYTQKIKENPNWRLAGIYPDEGITGTLMKKRKNFLRMLRDCKKGKIDMVLTKSISRFARNTVDCVQTIRELKALGIPILFEKENINTMEVDTETFITLQSCMAQAESESISGNVKWGVRRGFAAGKVRYNFQNWYGYEKDEDGQPCIRPEEAEVVRRIYAAYLAGHSLKQIADDLNAAAIPTRKGTPWACAVVRGILKNERYCGDAISQKTYVKDCISKKVVKNQGELPMYYLQDAHPGIVDRTTWHQVQAETAKRTGRLKSLPRPDTTGLQKYSGKFALTELLVCGECGSPYKRRTWKLRDGSRAAMWRCASRVEHGPLFCKQSPSIEESRLHAALATTMRQYLGSREHLLETLEGNLTTALAAEHGRGTLAGMLHRQRELQNALYELAAVLQDESEIAAHATQLDRIRDELDGLKAAIAQAEQGKPKTALAAITEVLEQAPLELENYDDMLARQLIELVQVDGGEQVTVTFRDGRTVVQSL